MLMGESDESVAPLMEQADFVRPFVPEGVPFRACSIPSACEGFGGVVESEGAIGGGGGGCGSILLVVGVFGK